MEYAKCECVPCAECNGIGVVFYSISGKYRGPYKNDDLDEYSPCPDCGGEGVIEMCYFCQCASDDLYDV